jgi:7-cyano-7-deazaguanine synthase
MNKAIVSLSGGLDSTVCLALAIKEHGADNVSTISFNYGQKHRRELESAEKVSLYYGVHHEVIDIRDIFKGGNSTLLADNNYDILEGSYIEQQSRSGSSKVSSYIPFRNGLMLSILASKALSLYPNDNIFLYLANHMDDSANDAYPDCSLNFIESMNSAIEIGTYNQCHIKSPFVDKTKQDIVELGFELSAPFALTTSCYNGREKACGKCATCIDRLNAFKAFGKTDPIEYESEEL